MKLIFILAMMTHEHCKVPLDESIMGAVCPGAQWAYTRTFTVNTSPCYDKGMNQEISEEKLKQYKKIFKVIEDPQGGISYCPGKSRYKKISVGEL